MKAEIVEKNSCKRNLVVEVPAEQVEAEINRLARKYMTNVKVPGFRPGKVPMNIVRQRYGSDLRADATQSLVSEHWQRALSEYDIKPLAEPVVEDIKSEPGEPLRFILAYEIMPALEVENYKGIAARLEADPVEEAEVEKALEALRERQAQYVPIDGGTVADGHLVAVTLEGEIEGGGKPIHEEDVNLVIGDPRTHEAFTENLRGANAGESRAFDVAFPAEFHNQRLAGKTVHYNVKIKEIKEKQLPALNDEFASEFGAGSFEEFKHKLRDDLVTKARKTAEEKAKESVLDQVVQAHRFDAPECLVQNELESRARRIVGSLARSGVDVSKTSLDWRKIFDQERPRAEQAVRRQIVLDAIARKENLEVSEEDLSREFEALSHTHRQSAAALRAQFEKENRMEGLRAYLLQNKALDFIYLNATISGG